MSEKLNEVLLDLTSAVQAGKLYSENHPKYTEIVEKVYAEIKNILKTKQELIIGIIDGELAWEDKILFDASRKIKSLLNNFQEKDIGNIKIFLPLEKKELEKFISFLSLPKRKHTESIQEYLNKNDVTNIQAGKVRAPSKRIKPAPPQETEKEHFKETFQNSMDSIKESAGKILNHEEIDYLDLRFNVLNLIEQYSGNHNELMDLISVKKKDVLTFVHMLNTSILAMFFASQLGISTDRVIDVGIAALFHDIGKIAISKKILKKKSKLRDSEFIQMKEHSLVGSKILLRYRSGLGILPAVVAFEHHLRYNKKGYPKLKYPIDLHLASKIVSICDVYDALFQRRTYKKHFPPMKIYEVITKGKNNLFDPELAERFFEIMGVWPLGTLVKLNDGRVGYVMKINKIDKFRPVVKIISPEEETGMVDLSGKNQETKITKSLDPFGEGEKYAELMASDKG